MRVLLPHLDVPRRMGFDVREFENLMSETESKRLTKM
jgi:hypothetical protein